MHSIDTIYEKYFRVTLPKRHKAQSMQQRFSHFSLTVMLYCYFHIIAPQVIAMFMNRKAQHSCCSLSFMRVLV